jgi:hypothetical protein
MEPSGRNRWQPVANATLPETAQIGETVAIGCDRLRREAHGKEGGRRFESARGLCKSAVNRRFLTYMDLHDLQRAVGMEPLWRPSG